MAATTRTAPGRPRRPMTGLVTLLKPAEVQRLLGVSRTWLYDAAKTGALPCVRLGGPDGPVRFHPDDVAAFIEASRRATAEDRER